MEFTAQQIADFLHGTVVGDATVKVNDVSKIEAGRKGTLTFMADLKFAHYLLETEASIAIVNRSYEVPEGVKPTLIQVDDARAAVAQLLTMVQMATSSRRSGIEQPSFIAEGVQVPASAYVGAFTYIAKGAKIGEGCQIYPQVYIGEGVEIGEGTTLYAGVKIYAGCKVGPNCMLHSGCVIGADGFGFVPQGDAYQKMPQIGNVILEGDNEIGANTTIDRSTMGSTIIHRGAKIDNLVQIGHNCEIGHNTILCGQVGVAGSTKIGDWCTMAGQVGLAGHLTIGDHVTAGAKTGIPGNIKDNQVVMGHPCLPARSWVRQVAMLKRIEQMWKDIEDLKKKS